MGSTNYFETFIEVAEDCPVEIAEIPAARGNNKTVALLQYEMIASRPYEFTSDDVIFEVYAQRNGIAGSDKPAARAEFFAKEQPCLRSSPLPKRYGWGIHHNENARVALVAVESPEYVHLVDDSSLTHLKAMRSRRD